MNEKYSLLDSGHAQRLERFGEYVLIRPCAQALWKPTLGPDAWNLADATFSREAGQGWKVRKKLPKQWPIELSRLRFNIALTDFGHVGIFPEHSMLWDEMRAQIKPKVKPKVQILNLFAYSGGATLAAAQAGASVCHLDASKGMVAWARENAALNGLGSMPIRWIVDDVMKFLKREIKRGMRYDGIILDPPTFGRGNRGEVFKFEQEIRLLLELCRTLLSDHPLFVYFTTHTPGVTPQVLEHLLAQALPKGTIAAKELLLPALQGLCIPHGSVARWTP